ncbi:SPX-domain-containing protein [Gigaspora margarita]|uniref:Vacuolar transporter chaperone complex subunit 4 n=1 Tax=Gigaspora margarita TaxID=4874 RepID=A0A8H4EHZ4_GIGMA|nr:SPX-domain-containing protein [Gigaspora margarita]
MKFGHHLKTSLYPEWTIYYVAYDDLKRELKTRIRNGQWSDDDEVSFLELLEKELDKVYGFQTSMSKDINKRVQLCEKEVNDVINDSEATEDRYLALEEELSLIIADVHDLAKFSRLNYSGFLKIIKKHDKQTNREIKYTYLSRLNAKPFFKETYDALIVKLSRLYDIVRTRGNPVKGNSASGGQQQNFVRNTTKYWVHPENITELKLLILKHLPVLVFNPDKQFDQADSAISSIYFDNDEFDLYLGRLEKTEGAEAIRLRWYGGMDVSEIFVERKTHREDWTGEKSVKERFQIKEKNVNKYLRGEHTMADDFKKLRDKGKSEKEIADLERLANEVQYRVLTKKLHPVLRTFYNRTAFQLPGDARVRISLDTELTMVREDNYGNVTRCGNNWRRMDIGIDYPFSQLPEEDVERFPYAVLEVKLQTQFGQEPPEWVQELVRSHLVEAVPKFSKFIHGVSTLVEENRVHLLPFWLPQMNVDIHKPPQGNYGVQRPLGALDTPSHEHNDPMSSGSSGQEESITVQIDNEDEITEETPLITDNDQESSRWLWTTPPTNVLEDETIFASTSTGQVPLQVPNYYKGRRVAVPVRVEPKVFFANERTFIAWLHFTIIINGFALGLLNFGSDDLSNIVAGTFMFVSLMIMLYALGMYLCRVYMIRKRSSGPYEDKFGPAFICGLLFVGVLVNFCFRFWDNEQFLSIK